MPEPDDGDYQDCVQMLADGVIEDIRTGAIKTQEAAHEQLHRHIDRSWLLSDDERAMIVLRYAKHRGLFLRTMATTLLTLETNERLHGSAYFQALGLMPKEADNGGTLPRPES